MKNVYIKTFSFFCGLIIFFIVTYDMTYDQIEVTSLDELFFIFGVVFFPMILFIFFVKIID